MHSGGVLVLRQSLLSAYCNGVVHPSLQSIVVVVAVVLTAAYITRGVDKIRRSEKINYKKV